METPGCPCGSSHRRLSFEPTYEGWKLVFGQSEIGLEHFSFEPTYEGWKPQFFLLNPGLIQF